MIFDSAAFKIVPVGTVNKFTLGLEAFYFIRSKPQEAKFFANIDDEIMTRPKLILGLRCNKWASGKNRDLDELFCELIQVGEFYFSAAKFRLSIKVDI